MIKTTFRLLAAALLTGATTAPGVAGTFADPDFATELQAPTPAISISLNLLSSPREGAPVVRVRHMGSGSWICSPAGFGQRSRCYRG